MPRGLLLIVLLTCREPFIFPHKQTLLNVLELYKIRVNLTIYSSISKEENSGEKMCELLFNGSLHL